MKTMTTARRRTARSAIYSCAVAVLIEIAVSTSPLQPQVASAFVTPTIPAVSPPSSQRRRRGSSKSTSSAATTSTRLHGLLDFLSPYESKIPTELKDEIYRAEANTKAAQDRGTRIALYTVVALLGIGLAVFNGFLTDIRINGLDGNGAGIIENANGSVGVDILVEAGFGWVLQNPVYRFLFTNKIGGGLSILLGGASGLLAEAELDTKRLNAEKIYEELERRREQKQNKKAKGGTATTSSAGSGKKKRRSGKERKRLGALSEVVVAKEEPQTQQQPDNNSSVATTAVADDEQPPSTVSNDAQSTQTRTPNKDGLLGQMKNLYDKADSMAASQALLLNKQLEDAGVLEKITDETGLKVIGKEEAKERSVQETTDKVENS